MTSNFDQQEINKFSALADDWWNVNGPFKPLHAINPLRLQFITKHVNLKNKKIIDVGCGGGILTESLAYAGADVIGIDMTATAIETAKQHWQQAVLPNTDVGTIDYQCISAEDMATQQAGKFDILTCLELLEHVPDPASTIQACAQLVKPGGHLFFSTINRNPKAYLMAVLGAEYILRLIPQGTHDYAKFIKPAELAQWLRAARLELREFKGLHYQPLRQQFYLNDDISVNYLVYCQKTGA